MMHYFSASFVPDIKVNAIKVCNRCQLRSRKRGQRVKSESVSSEQTDETKYGTESRWPQGSHVEEEYERRRQVG